MYWFGKSNNDIESSTNFESLYSVEWTTEPPTVAGFFWVNFRVSAMNLKVVVKYPLDGTEANMNLATHWLGPIPEPETPKE